MPKYLEYWSMSRAEGLNAASTGSMSSACPRVQAVPAVQTSKIIGVLRVSRIFNFEILQHSSKNTPSNTLTNSTSQYKFLKYCEYYDTSKTKIPNTRSIESISSAKCRNTASSQSTSNTGFLNTSGTQ